MWDFFVRLFNSKALRLLIRLVASVASAVVVISGFIFWQSQQKSKSNDPEEEDDDDLPRRDNVHHLHRK